MLDEKSLSIAEDFLRSLKAKRVEQVLSLFPEEGVWIAPEGTFTGKGSIRTYLDWQFSQGQDLKITESGNGVVVQANRAFIEHTVVYKRDGEHVEYIVLCALELKDGKVARVRTVYDRLSLERQTARGRLSKWAVDRLMRQAEKGLRWPGN
jgi:ketosteroid isomerase-like protein